MLRRVLQNQTGYLVVTYRLLNHYSNDFNEFLSNFEKLLNHVKQLSAFFVILGDFNAVRWYNNIWKFLHDSLSLAFGLRQVICQPIHLLPTSPTCTDLVFTNQPNLVVNSGAHPSLQRNCYHHITSFSHLDYGDIIYDQSCKVFLSSEIGIQSVQHQTSNNKSYNRGI